MVSGIETAPPVWIIGLRSVAWYWTALGRTDLGGASPCPGILHVGGWIGEWGRKEEAEGQGAHLGWGPLGAVERGGVETFTASLSRDSRLRRGGCAASRGSVGYTW